MKRFVLLGAILFSSLSSAEIYYKPANKSEGSYYISCESCDSKADYREKAESKALALSSEEAQDRLTFVVFNIASQEFKTIRVSNALNSINSKVVKNRRFDKRYLEEFLADKRQFNALYKYEPLSFYLAGGSYAPYSEWLNVVDTFDNGFANVSLSWFDTPAFAEAMRSEVNEIVKNQEINPFRFIQAPLSINVLTPNMEVVNMTAKELSSNPNWTVNLVFSEQEVYGAQGNLLESITEYDESFTCFASEEFEFCRQLIPGSNIAIGDVIFRLRVFGTGSPARPPGCNLVINNCGKIDLPE